MRIGDSSRRHNEPTQAPAGISVLVVARVAIHREGIARLLSECPGIRVVGTTTKTQRGVGRIRELRPDVALVDLPTEDLCSLALILREAAPDVRLVALVACEAEGKIVMSAGAGVYGYVTRDASVGELAQTIERAAGYGRPAPVSTPRAAIARAALTERQREILEMVGQGLANKEIARRLQIELPTVKSHIHNILRKLGVNSRTEAAALVLEPPAEL
jgi:two-component system, NarL family, nitrate/nitrite response regulator NarL